MQRHSIAINKNRFTIQQLLNSPPHPYRGRHDRTLRPERWQQHDFVARVYSERGRELDFGLCGLISRVRDSNPWPLRRWGVCLCSAEPLLGLLLVLSLRSTPLPLHGRRRESKEKPSRLYSWSLSCSLYLNESIYCLLRMQKPLALYD